MTSGIQLVRCIKEHVDAIHKAGFHIVATVCDQGSTNISAIKQLLLQTEMDRHLEKRPQSKINLFCIAHITHVSC